MHEQALMDGLMRQIEQVAAADGAARVTAVSVWCGALSHFTPEHFREYFERASAGTVAEGAEVAVEVSDVITHPDAAGVRLESVEVED
ncbi:MAG TPA: hydrogenase maturation nickel metallochaperone HypA [Gaiellaceae bacterium]|nr:hydrogenase maturation nickel metallochaperone HypA [Gaiellaceae bacterium]